MSKTSPGKIDLKTRYTAWCEPCRAMIRIAVDSTSTATPTCCPMCAAPLVGDVGYDKPDAIGLLVYAPSETHDNALALAKEFGQGISKDQLYERAGWTPPGGLGSIVL